MANKRISALDDITVVGGTSTAEVNANDILPITDVDDTTGSAQGTTKAVKVSDLMGEAPVQSVNTATGAVVLDADDIDDSSTSHKFVTASDITNLGNLSGTNSGDQDLSGLATQVSLSSTESNLTSLINLRATQVSLGNHESLTSAVHGISAFGATLVDDTDAATARTTLEVDQAGTDNSTDVTLATVPNNYLSLSGQEITAGVVPVSLGGTGSGDLTTARANLGLGTAATTASTDYATAAQGTLADSATQPSDNISTLTNDSGFIAGLTAGELGDFDFDDNAIFGFAAKVETPTITANAYTLLDSDNGKVLALDNGATAMTLNVDTGLPASFNCSFIQKGAGQVTFGGTATVNNRQSHTKINDQYGVASIVAYATDTYILAGDTAA
jgi:hypothetical protein